MGAAAHLTILLSYKLDSLLPTPMEQTDFIPRNKSEEMRAKAWTQLQQGKLGRYTILSTLGLERHTIADKPGAEEIRHV